MNRVTVRWHDGAIQDPAQLWLAAPDRPRMEAAANELAKFLTKHRSHARSRE